MKLIVLMFTLLIVGCTNPSWGRTDALAELPEKISPVNEGGFIHELPNPPSPLTYVDIDINDKVLREYTNDVNWYFTYMFSYVSTLNRYAAARGWTPSELPVLCRLIVRNKSAPLPEFSPTSEPEGGISLFKLELLEHIDEIRDVHIRNTSESIRADAYQKYLCTF